MSKANFAITTDLPNSLIKSTLTGIWDREGLRSYRDNVRSVYRNLARQGCGPDRLLLLIDITRVGVQSQDVLPDIESMIAEHSSVALRTARVVSSALHTLQVRRLTKDHRSRSFVSEAEAMQWLLTGVEPVGADCP